MLNRLIHAACRRPRLSRHPGPGCRVVRLLLRFQAHASLRAALGLGRAAWACTLMLAALLPQAAGAATLVVEMSGVENDHGLVRVAVYTLDTFTTKHCAFTAATPARAGMVTVSVDGVPPGRYAAQAYHDEDGNGRLRRGLFGIPTEAIGFSRDAPVRLGAPRFEDAAIEVCEPTTTIRLRLRHVGP